MPVPQGLSKYRDFWPHYLAEHRQRLTRRLHLLGTALGLALLAATLISGRWWLLPAALTAAYGLAWTSHAFVERNRPATFSYPLWSLISDLRMLLLWLGGGLEGELQRHRLG
jgi:hypothetical protein